MRDRLAAADPDAGAADALDPTGDEGSEDEAEGGRHDGAAQPGHRRPAQDEAEADADQDERPEPPQVTRDAGVRPPPLHGERDPAERDQEDAPVQEASIDAHDPLSLPTACVVASPSVTWRCVRAGAQVGAGRSRRGKR